MSKYKSNPDADLPPARFWNNTGRGYPDVSALGGEHTPYCVVTGGRAEGVAGTSASCPVFAAVVAKLNAIRLKAKKPALGFLNPFIYQNPQAFNDVTQGMNGVSKEEAFKAVAGWDAVSSLTSPLACQHSQEVTLTPHTSLRACRPRAWAPPTTSCWPRPSKRCRSRGYWQQE